MKLLLLTALFCTSFAFSQNAKQTLPENLEQDRLELGIDSLPNAAYAKAYRIWTGLQVLEFYQLENGDFTGFRTDLSKGRTEVGNAR